MKEKDGNETINPITPQPQDSSTNIDITGKEKSNKECKVEVSKFNEKLKIETTDVIPRLTKICTYYPFSHCLSFLEEFILVPLLF